MTPTTYSRFVLAERPAGHITPTTFKKESASLPNPGKEQVLVQVLYLSIDPAMRGWLSTSQNSSCLEFMA